MNLEHIRRVDDKDANSDIDSSKNGFVEDTFGQKMGKRQMEDVSGDEEESSESNSLFDFSDIAPEDIYIRFQVFNRSSSNNGSDPLLIGSSYI